MKGVAIIWNMAHEFKDDIVNRMSERVEIVRKFDVNLGDKYFEFVRRIYEGEPVEKWKIDNKIKCMKRIPLHHIYVVLYEFDSADVYYSDDKERVVYTQIQDMKDVIREEFSTKVKFYYYDVTFHCSDDELEYEKNLRIIDEFIN